MLGRREVIQNFLTAALVFSLGRKTSRTALYRQDAKVDGAVIRQYNRLGKTDLRVSDVGFGVSVSTDPQLLVEAYRRGINYFDLSPFYSWSTKMLADAFKLDDELRSKAIVASKVECENLFYLTSRKPLHQVIIGCIDKTLKTLGRDYFDILQIHSVGEGGEEDLDWLDPNKRLGAEAVKLFEVLKRDGKIRYSGLSTHGPRFLETVVEKAIASGNFDMLMVALNFMQSPGLAPLLRSGAEKGIGIIAMKALANARALKISTSTGAPFIVSAIKWALAQPGVHGTVITIPDHEALNLYLRASGEKLTSRDQIRLWLARTSSSKRYCRVGCGKCMSSCPVAVEIPTILRFDQYRSDYGLLERAREQYRSLPRDKRPYACMTCGTVNCETACPFGVSIRSRLLAACRHLDLSTIV